MTTPPKKLTVTEGRQELIDQAVALMEGAKTLLEELFDDLEEKRSNMEEKFSQTERYQKFEDACDTLRSVIDSIEQAQEEAQVELP